MNGLGKFRNKQVKLIDIENKEWVGVAKYYTQALDNLNNKESICVKLQGEDKSLIEFEEDEIKSIEIIEE